MTDSNPWSVSVVDINGDGNPDLVLALPDNNAVDVILGKVMARWAPSRIRGRECAISTVVGDLSEMEGRHRNSEFRR